MKNLSFLQKLFHTLKILMHFFEQCAHFCKKLLKLPKFQCGIFAQKTTCFSRIMKQVFQTIKKLLKNAISFAFLYQTTDCGLWRKCGKHVENPSFLTSIMWYFV